MKMTSIFNGSKVVGLIKAEVKVLIVLVKACGLNTLSTLVNIN